VCGQITSHAMLQQFCTHQNKLAWQQRRAGICRASAGAGRPVACSCTHTHTQQYL
jgi:hypothetical protein